MNQFLPARVRAVLSLLALSVAVFAIAPRAFAQANANPPERIAYQGFLVDANGIPLGTNAPKNYDLIFRIWSDPNVGTRLWTEQQTVTVDKGYFSVVLGEGSFTGETRPALSTIFTNSSASDRWIGLTVKGIGPSGTDANILPRLRLLTSPYAFLATKAMSVDGAGVMSGTIGDARLSTNVALRGGGNTFSGNQIINNNLGIGTTAPDRPLTIRAAGAPNGEWLSLKDVNDVTRWHVNNEASGLNFVQTSVADNRLFLANSGNVGIGTNTPAAKLHVSGGNIQVDSGNQLVFADNGEIRCSDANHRIMFRRGENKLELREYGDIIFSPGALTGGENVAVTMKNTGNMGVGTTNPAAKLHVAGTMRVDGSISGTMTMAGAGNFLGSTPYVRLSDEKPKGTEGGSSIVGINTRTFNTEYDPQNIASTNSNTNIVLPPGTYQCSISAPAFRVNYHQTRLRNVTSNTVLLYGTSKYADTADGGDVISSTITGQFTLNAQSTLVVEHYTSVAKANQGLGLAVNATWGDANAKEVYTVAEFWKLQ